jgi:hypothetical protein
MQKRKLGNFGAWAPRCDINELTSSYRVADRVNNFDARMSSRIKAIESNGVGTCKRRGGSYRPVSLGY